MRESRSACSSTYATFTSRIVQNQASGLSAWFWFREDVEQILHESTTYETRTYPSLFANRRIGSIFPSESVTLDASVCQS